MNDCRTGFPSTAKSLFESINFPLHANEHFLFGYFIHIAPKSLNCLTPLCTPSLDSGLCNLVGDEGITFIRETIEVTGFPCLLLRLIARLVRDSHGAIRFKCFPKRDKVPWNKCHHSHHRIAP